MVIGEVCSARTCTVSGKTLDVGVPTLFVCYTNSSARNVLGTGLQYSDVATFCGT